MPELPRDIAGWAEPLSIFKAELAEALGVWLPVLAGLIGPLRQRDRDGEVSVDGVSGLSRRGSYERLLVSEWAILSAAPLEFLRRAAGSEHLFVDVKRQEPAGSRRCLVLLDSGPEQLGAPRIVHLAALIVLERRAALAGAELAWGSLQHGHAPSRTVDRDSLRSMLRGRSTEPVTAAQLGGRLEAFEHPQPGDELWLLGGPTLSGLAPRGATVLDISDADHPDGTLSLELSRAGTGGGRRRVALPLPPARLQPTLLRHPFRSLPAPTRSALVPVGSLAVVQPDFQFSHSGSRLLAVEQDSGDFVAIRLPTGGQQLRVERLMIPSDNDIVGLGYHKGPYLLLSDRLEGTLSVFGRNYSQVLQGPVSAEGYPHPEVFLHRHLGKKRTRFRLGDQLIDYDHQSSEASVHAEGCLGLWMRDGRSMYIADQGDGLALYLEVSDGSVDQKVPVPQESRAAYVGHMASTAWGLVVVEVSPEEWAVVGHRKDTLRVPAGATVLGCQGFGSPTLRPGLLVCSDDGLTLALVRSGMSLALPTESARVVHAVASPARSEVAWMTDDGTVTIWDTRTDSRVAVITAEVLE